MAPCGDTAYVTVLTSHAARVGPSTFVASNGSTFGTRSKHERQLQMLVVLVRSLREVKSTAPPALLPSSAARGGIKNIEDGRKKKCS